MNRHEFLGVWIASHAISQHHFPNEASWRQHMHEIEADALAMWEEYQRMCTNIAGQ